MEKYQRKGLNMDSVIEYCQERGLIEVERKMRSLLGYDFDDLLKDAPYVIKKDRKKSL